MLTYRDPISYQEIFLLLRTCFDDFTEILIFLLYHFWCRIWQGIWRRFGAESGRGFHKNPFSLVFDAIGATKPPYTFMNTSNYAGRASRALVDHWKYLQTNKNAENVVKTVKKRSISTERIF